MPGSDGFRARLRAHPWTDGRFNLCADYTFVVPGDIEYPTVRMNHQQLAFGAEFALFAPRTRLTVSPFAAAGAGIHRALRYSNVIPDFELQQRVSPIVTAEAGVRMCGRLAFPPFKRNALYGITVSDRLSVPAYRVHEHTPAGTVTFIEIFNSVPVGLVVAVDF
jgi:hypothetical protein